MAGPEPDPVPVRGEGEGAGAQEFTPLDGTAAFHSYALGPEQLPMTNPETTMSKGMDRKKEDRKKPAKSLKEKRAEKQAKRANRA